MSGHMPTISFSICLVWYLKALGVEICCSILICCWNYFLDIFFWWHFWNLLCTILYHLQVGIILFSFFFYHLIFIFSLTVAASTTDTILNRNGDSVHPRFELKLHQVLSISENVSCGFLMLRWILSSFTLSGTLFVKICWNKSIYSLASIKLIMWFLSWSPLISH